MIREIKYSEIEKYSHICKKEYLVFCKKTKYFGYYQDECLLGFTGILLYKNKCIFKNHYVFKPFRNRGIFRKLFDFSIDYAIKSKIMTVEATCTNSSIKLYLENNFTIIKTYKKYKKVRYENIFKSKCS